MEDSARKTMASASSAIPTSDPALLLPSVTSAISEVSRADVSFVATKAFRTRSTAKNVPKWKRIEMAALKLSILDLQRLICGTKERSMVSRNGHD